MRIKELHLYLLIMSQTWFCYTNPQINFSLKFFYKTIYTILYYVEVIRTLNNKYQKFMTYPLVYNIKNFVDYKNIDNKTRTCKVLITIPS